jgi:hypothetical protein
MYDVVDYFLSVGMSCDVHDDYGRTIWHDACWTVRPAWPLMELLLERAPHLLCLKDIRGHLPADYIPKSEYKLWLDFWKSNKTKLHGLLSTKSKHRPEDDAGPTIMKMMDMKNNTTPVLASGAKQSPSSAASRATIAAMQQLALLRQQRRRQQQDQHASSMKDTIMHPIQEDDSHDEDGDHHHRRRQQE